MTVQNTAADERRNKPHCAPRVRREPSEEDVVPHVVVARVIGRVPRRAVVHDRQTVFGGGAPDRIEIRVIHRNFVDLRLDRDGHFDFPHVLISSSALSTSRVEATIGPFSRSGYCPQKSAMWRWNARIMPVSSEASLTPIRLDHPPGTRKCTSVPSSSMSATRFAALSSCTPG